MTTWTVKPSGGDYTTLAAALSNASTVANDIIEISGDWTSASDTTAAVISDSGIKITCTGVAYHDGDVNKAAAYTLAVGGGSHCLQISNDNAIVEKFIIRQTTTTGDSEEGIRIDDASVNPTINRCIIWTSTGVTNQDGIYYANGSQTINVNDCIIMGFDRVGIHYQNYSGFAAGVFNVRSCFLADNGKGNPSVGSTQGGGVSCKAAGGTKIMNIHNTVCVENDTGPGVNNDYDENIIGGAITWNISNSIDSDASITALGPDTGSNNFASKTLTDGASPPINSVVVIDSTGALPWDLRLKTHANNDAEEVHSNDTAHGMTITGGLDIEGNTRATSFSIGAHELNAAVGGGDGTDMPWPDFPSPHLHTPVQKVVNY